MVPRKPSDADAEPEDALALSSVSIGDLRRSRNGLRTNTWSESGQGLDTEEGSPNAHSLFGRLSRKAVLERASGQREPMLLGNYQIEERVGTGGMGQVFAARSLCDDRRVALKILHRSSADALLRLKHEFRVLAEVKHPNLVNLGELVAKPDAQPFFTMDLIEGTHFVRYVRRRTRPGRPPNPTRLRRALTQLVSAVEHLHAKGLVHRDLKPANVLVTEDGHVTVLDFGLVHEVTSVSEYDEGHVLGTPAYMAPEQAALGSAGPPADMYSVGVMLFECLCGRRPFEGSANAVLTAKREAPARDLAELVPGCDPELIVLSRALLARDPAQRPTASAVLEQLQQMPRSPDFSEASFVGRMADLECLDASLVELNTCQRPIITLVCGPSGQGKTSLLSNWLSTLDGDSLVLRGRCLERESVPFKGLDTIVDALAWQLRQMPAPYREALRPENASALTGLFPVLAGLWLESTSLTRGLEPAEQRRRAVSSLRNLISGLARLQVVVIILDDFQWADTDSAWLLEQLIDHVAGPPVSLVLAYREPPEPGPAITRIRALRKSPHVVLREHELGPLTPLEARDLILPLVALKQSRPCDDAEVLAKTEAMVREAEGNPLHLRELVRGRHDEIEFDLDRLITRRILELPANQRQTLVLVALVRGPVERGALEAAGSNDDAIDALVADDLLHVSELGGSLVEPLHERIGRMAIGELDPDSLPGYHLQLATAFARIDASPELLAEHFACAGDHERAFLHAERASHQAMDALAFNRAAAWLERCVAWLPRNSDTIQRRRDLERRLVTAYVNSGRLIESAELLLAQANEPGTNDAAALRTQAVEYLLICGRMQDGVREAGKALAAVGLTMPRGRLLVLLNTFRYRRGLARDLRRFERGVTPRNDPLLRAQAEICRALASGFAAHDVLLVLYFLGRWRRLSLEIGDHKSFGYALRKDAVMSAGIGASERGRELCERARKLVGPGEHETLFFDGVLACIEAYSANWGKALEYLEVAWPKFQTQPEMQWERRIISVALVWVYLENGRFRDAIALGRQLVHQGIELGDIKQIRNASALLACTLICVGDLDAAELALADMQDRERGFVDDRYLIADAFRDFARIGKLLQMGQPELALSVANRLPTDMKREGLWAEANLRYTALTFTATAQLQVWQHSPSRGGFRRMRKLIRSLARASIHHQGNGAVIDAALCQTIGDIRCASTLLMKAEACFVSSGAQARLAAVRTRRAALVGEEEARHLIAQADEYFRGETICDRDALLKMLAPGRW